MMDPSERLKAALADRYSIEREIGEGGMATVYLAEDLKHHREVALKVLKPEIAAALGSERFLQEIQIAAKLNHPHILTLIDSGNADGLLYYVMPYIAGESLRAQLVQETQLALDDALRVTEQVAAALDYAHRQGVIHRDIKPENILRHEGQALVTDFGIALAVREAGGERLTQTGFVVGTPFYMSPEQASGEREVDARSDVYSLGCVLYEMLTGEPPHTGPTAQAIIAKRMTDPAPSARRLRDTIPVSVDEALCRALARTPADRFKTTSAFAEALKSTPEMGKPMGNAPAPTPASPPLDIRASDLSFTATLHTVGRQGVVDALQNDLDDVRENRRGKIVCITGEAGIGKTTVVENFLAGLASDGRTIAKGRCSERLAGAEAYLPLLDALESLHRGAYGQTVDELMVRTAPSWHRQVASQSEPGTETPPEGASSQERLMRELALFFEQLSRDQPFVLFLEDLHWADVSTVDALSHVADRFDRVRALLLVTYRPEDMRLDDHAFLQVRPTLEHRGVLREVPLGFLQLGDVQRYLALEFAGEHFPQGLSDLIHSKTEGSPLFMADLVRDLRQRNVFSESDGGWTLTESLETIGRELPGSIRSMISRKIDQLDTPERRIALTASVQGEEFDGAVLARALDMDPITLEEHLERIEGVHALITRLREHELPDGTPTLRYRFVHVLYQNTLYASITPAKRVSLSLAVATALEHHYQKDTSRVATTLGFLYEAGRDPERATGFFLQAASHASRVSAHHEVSQLARRGIGALASMPETPERARTELSLRTLLAPTIMAISGWAAPEAEENNRHLEELCRSVGDDREIFAMLFSWLAFYLVRANPERARPLGEECIELATRLQDPALLFTAHAAAIDVQFLLGEFVRARHHMETALELWGRREWSELQFFVAQHPVVTSLGSGAWILMWLGFPDQALRSARQAVETAGGLSHPFSTLFAFTYLGHVHESCGELSAVRDATAQMELAGEDEFPYFTIEGLTLRGRLLARSGSLEDGLEKMLKAVALSDAGGFVLFRTRIISWIAEALAQTGRVSEGLDHIEQGFAIEQNGGLLTFHAELHRTKGDLLRLAGRDPAEVESCYRSALDFSRKQQARGFELRATLSWARFLRDEGRGEEAREGLQRICDWFTEGFETPDFRAARQLIEELKP